MLSDNDDMGEQMHQPHTPRRVSATLPLIVALSATLLLAGPPRALTGALGPAAALAGTWAQLVCAQPGGQPAPTDGFASATTGGLATNGCNPYAGGLIAAVNSAAQLPPLAGAVWGYTAPAGSTIAGGSISLSLYAPEGLAYVATPAPTYDPADVLAACQTGFPCGGQVDGLLTETVPITHPGGTSLYAIAQCLPPGGGDCPAGGGGAGLDAEVNVYQATIDLTNNATPAASGFAGGLLAPGPVSGLAPLTFTATDPGGPGVYRVTVSVDSHDVYAQTPDSNGGHCVSPGPDAAGNDTFLYAAPCKQSLAVSVAVATSGLADGSHELAVTVTDAARNSSIVLRQAFMTSNRTKVSADLNGNTPPGTTSGSTTTGGAAAQYAVVLDSASQALLAHAVKRTYAGSALRVAGTLRNAAGVPVPGVPLGLLAQDGNTGAPVVIAQAVSDAAGHWALSAPRGPSRTLTVAYGPTAQLQAHASVKISETVTPGLALTVQALHRGRLRFTGQLKVSPLGTPRPQVVIEAGKGTHWQSIGQPVTVNAAGRYTLNYNAGPNAIGGHYSFRAISPPTALFTAATSATRKAVVR
jgi:hypothetical protein